MNILPTFQNIKKGNYSKEEYIRVIEEQEGTIRNLGYQICALQSKVEIMQREARTIAEDAYAKGKEDGRREAEDEERPQGEWIGDTDYESCQGMYERYKCSECGYGIGWREHNQLMCQDEIPEEYREYYCPHCGADMREADE